MSGTIGQPDAGGPMTNGQYSITGGFWVLPVAVQVTGAPTLTIVPAAAGQATKEQIQLMVRAILALQETPQPADAADALAVALCHLQAEHTRRRFVFPAEAPSTHAARAAGGATHNRALPISTRR